MINPKAMLAGLANSMGPGGPPMKGMGRGMAPKAKRVGMGGVPDQAPMLDKAKAILGGVPLAIRGKKPRLGGL